MGGAGSSGLTRGSRALGGCSTFCRRLRLARQCGFGNGAAPFPLQCSRGGPRAFRRHLRGFSRATFFGILGRFLPRFLGHGSFLRQRHLHPRPTCLGQSDGDGLFGGARAVFARADFIDFFANEFAGLRRRRFPRLPRGGRTLGGGFLRHAQESNGSGATDSWSWVIHRRMPHRCRQTGPRGLPKEESDSQDTSLAGSENDNPQANDSLIRRLPERGIGNSPLLLEEKQCALLTSLIDHHQLSAVRIRNRAGKKVGGRHRGKFLLPILPLLMEYVTFRWFGFCQDVIGGETAGHQSVTASAQTKPPS